MTSTSLIPALALFASFAFCQPSSLIVDGGNGKSITITVADLAELPQHIVRYMKVGERYQKPPSIRLGGKHETPVFFEGVFLSDVLAKVEMPSGEKLGGKFMALYVLVEAADGYRAVFSLPELDPAFTDHKIYLVAKRDGKPLPEKEGPFRIVVPDEKRPSRWVRQVTAIRIREAS